MKVWEFRDLLDEYDEDMEVVFSNGEGKIYEFNNITINFIDEE